MSKFFKTSALCFALIVAGTPSLAVAAQFGLNLRFTVPRICTVNSLTSPYIDQSSIRIDEVREFCNGSGYQILLSYEPGTLVGSTARLGEHEVVLDGSGEVLLVDAPYAVSRISSLEIVDVDLDNITSSLSLRMLPR